MPDYIFRGEMKMPRIQLTRHENEGYESQTLMVSGHGFVGCSFSKCTLIVTNTHFMLKNCKFKNCNWRLEYDLLWGDKGSCDRLRQLLDLIDGGKASEKLSAYIN